jgi:membrane protein
MQVKTYWDILKRTFKEYSEDKVSRLAAALAYYTALSVAPLLIITLAVAGMALGEEAARGEIAQQIEGLVGEQGAKSLQGILASAHQEGSGWALAVGLVLLFLGASGVFVELQESLNTIWEVAPKPGMGLFATIRQRLLSFSMVLGIGFVLLVSLFVNAALSAAVNFVGLGGAAVVGHLVNLILSLWIITVLFALIFKYLPDVHIQWRDVWVGAGLTAVLFTIGKTLIGLYLGHSSVGSAYGAAGSLVVFLVWVYYSTQILFLGAEFTKAYANRLGSRIQPAEHAVPLTPEDRAQQGIPKDEELEKRVSV